LAAAQQGAEVALADCTVRCRRRHEIALPRLVTDVDRAAEAAITQFLLQHRLHDALGEETGGPDPVRHGFLVK
jgi:fructose-1,6-bisphosphatase/inositol monophosphatase family enzyme